MTRKEPEPKRSGPQLHAGELVMIDLAEEAAKLSQTIGSRDRQAVNLVKDGPLNVLLMTLKKGAELSEHRTRGPITVHVISGAIRFDVKNQQIALGAGYMLSLERDVAHSLTALEDSSVLLTTAIA
jgi:quercetin dioxygenase-like cupin family protein